MADARFYCPVCDIVIGGAGWNADYEAICADFSAWPQISFSTVTGTFRQSDHAVSKWPNYHSGEIENWEYQRLELEGWQVPRHDKRAIMFHQLCFGPIALALGVSTQSLRNIVQLIISFPRRDGRWEFLTSSTRASVNITAWLLSEMPQPRAYASQTMAVRHVVRGVESLPSEICAGILNELDFSSATKLQVASKVFWNVSCQPWWSKSRMRHDYPCVMKIIEGDPDLSMLVRAKAFSWTGLLKKLALQEIAGRFSGLWRHRFFCLYNRVSAASLEGQLLPTWWDPLRSDVSPEPATSSVRTISDTTPLSLWMPTTLLSACEVPISRAQVSDVAAFWTTELAHTLLTGLEFSTESGAVRLGYCHGRKSRVERDHEYDRVDGLRCNWNPSMFGIDRIALNMDCAGGSVPAWATNWLHWFRLPTNGRIRALLDGLKIVDLEVLSKTISKE